MIEIVAGSRCIACDRCIDVCPTRVFDRGADGVPVIARQGNCQTCFQCEAYCPTDALFVAPVVEPVPEGSPMRDLEHVIETGLMGSYRAALGWGGGRTLGARLAIQPEMP
ncbi:MAG: ferredoxin family protein [Mycobacterium sp.]